MNAERIAKALGGRPNAEGWLCRCPLSTHGKGRGDRNPSLSVRDGDTNLVVKCFSGCDPLDILDDLRKRGLLEDKPGRRAKARRPTTLVHSAPIEPAPDPRALRLWLAAKPITGTLGETYLRQHRGITIELPLSLRFGYAFHHPTGLELPAVIAAIARPHDRKIVAVACTFLTETGEKCPVTKPRLNFGSFGSGAVRLAPVTDTIGISEGVEKALAAMQLTGIPTWSTAGAGRLASITLPDPVHTVHLFCDNDEPGRNAAKIAAARYSRTGRKVIVRFPPEGFKDYDAITKAQAVA